MSRTHRIVWSERVGPAENARRQLPRMAALFFVQVRAALAVRTTPEQLHRIRLAAKRLRYTLELFRPCYGRGLESRIESLRSLQQVLGEINDCAATRRVLERELPVSVPRTRAERFLAARLREKSTELRALWAEIFDAPGQESAWTQYLERHARTPRTPGNPRRRLPVAHPKSP